MLRGRAWRPRSGAPGPRGRAGSPRRATRRLMRPCTPDGTSRTLLRIRPCARESFDAEAAMSGGRVWGTGVIAETDHHACTEVEGQVDHLLRRGATPGPARCRAATARRCPCCPRPRQLGLLPRDLAVDAVLETHDGSARAPVEERIGVEARDRVPLEVGGQDLCGPVGAETGVDPALQHHDQDGRTRSGRSTIE